LLDAQDPIPGQYTLEVSVAGVERPLSGPAQFARYLGETVFVELALPLEAGAASRARWSRPTPRPSRWTWTAGAGCCRWRRFARRHLAPDA